MLVRVRDNALWYLPGGTIEAGETPEQALVREIDEELGVAIDGQSMKFDQRIALDRRRRCGAELLPSTMGWCYQTDDGDIRGRLYRLSADRQNGSGS